MAKKHNSLTRNNLKQNSFNALVQGKQDGKADKASKTKGHATLYAKNKIECKVKLWIHKRSCKILLKVKAVFLRPTQPFTWASGIKSPIYCDNRLTLAYPEERKFIENALADIVKKEYPECEALFGTSTAGIPHAAIMSEILSLPMGYVRSSEKTHGRENKIEGANPGGKKVVVVEDLISTGGSSIDVVNALREAGATVLGIVSVFTYGLKKGIEKLEAACVVNHSVSNFDAVVEVAQETGYINEKEKEMLVKFRSDPSDGSWMSI